MVLIKFYLITRQMFFLVGLLVTKKKKVELDRKGDINTIIHYITYACPNAVASLMRGSICLVSPDLGRFWGGA